ncbi:double-stranded RNA-binding motif protein [Ceratobasidium sp. AG-Ba]|nr:double-stranded RNA-binding motif protein [Ceratobasidium sp. AG-Ba]QRV93387.1 double-stranded RNA-binding motif protein [Ceratobasidium sp. AG-Ba]
MAHHKTTYDRWYRQQAGAPPLQWSGSIVPHKGQNAWLVEVTMNDRVVARAHCPTKDIAENECAKQLLVYFRVPHD